MASIFSGNNWRCYLGTCKRRYIVHQISMGKCFNGVECMDREEIMRVLLRKGFSKRGNDIANSAKFYTSTGDWCTPALSSWDMSLYNPCPSGWRVPTNLEYFNLESSGSTWTDAGGPDNLAGRWIGPGNSVEETRATTSIFLPAAGNRQYNNGLFGSSNYYWTSTISGSLSFQVSFSSSSYGRSTNIRGYGAAIRCVKN